MRRHYGRRGQLGDLPDEYFRQGKKLNAGLGLIPDWQNNQTTANFPFVIGTVSQQIIPSNPLRAYVMIQNKDAAADMFVNFGSDATQFNGVIIIPRGNYEFVGGAPGAFVPSDSIHVLGAAANMRGVITEGILPPITPGS